MKSRKQSVLFLCTGNSCRSQMAEGFARSMVSDRWIVRSAGTEVHGLNPYAVKVMAESGIDISDYQSQSVDELDLNDFDFVITVCDHAEEQCPYVPGRVKKIHRSFPDPPKLAETARSEEDVLECYRNVRDEIQSFVTGFFHENDPAVALDS